mgnify:CR=1 FL=1
MQNNIPIFLASNDKYAPFVATTIASVCYNTKSFCEFYILDSGISNLNKERIELLKEKFNNFSIEYLSIDLSKFAGFKLLPHISLDAYSRFFIPVLKPELDKVIYLDVDVSVLGDIKELYNVNLEDFYLGAISEYYFIKQQEALAEKLDIEYNDEKQFFNSGILLINSKKWRENDITQKLFEIQNKYNSVLDWGDQDVLIKQFYKDYLVLDSKFNLLSGQIIYKSEFSTEVEKMVDNAIKNPIIRHFETPNKPWLTNKNFYSGDLQNFDDFWFFAKMTDFYEILKFKYFNGLFESKKGGEVLISNGYFVQKTRLNLFGIISLLKIIKKNNRIYYKLFGFIPWLKVINKDDKTYYKLFGFIPGLKVIHKNNQIYYKLFDFITLLRIKKI